MKFCSNVYQVKKIKKKTTAIGFGEIREGDTLTFRINLRRTAGYRGLYALEVETENFRTGLAWSCTQNNFLNRIDHFELALLGGGDE
jgi:hypothetical protein